MNKFYHEKFDFIKGKISAIQEKIVEIINQIKIIENKMIKEEKKEKKKNDCVIC